MTYSLFLYPASSNEIAITATELTDYLTELEFSSSSAGSDTLFPGKKLMDYITFLGCSPSIKLGEIAPTIKVHRFDLLTGMGGESVETIRYPDCKHPVNEPMKLLKNYSYSNLYQCSICANKGKIDDINWRKTAGFAKIFIEISQIFPQEAIPADKLLGSLENFTKMNWKWFYSRTGLYPWN